MIVHRSVGSKLQLNSTVYLKYLWFLTLELTTGVLKSEVNLN